MLLVESSQGKKDKILIMSDVLNSLYVYIVSLLITLVILTLLSFTPLFRDYRAYLFGRMLILFLCCVPSLLYLAFSVELMLPSVKLIYCIYSCILA